MSFHPQGRSPEAVRTKVRAEDGSVSVEGPRPGKDVVRPKPAPRPDPPPRPQPVAGLIEEPRVRPRAEQAYARVRPMNPETIPMIVRPGRGEPVESKVRPGRGAAIPMTTKPVREPPEMVVRPGRGAPPEMSARKPRHIALPLSAAAAVSTPRAGEKRVEDVRAPKILLHKWTLHAVSSVKNAHRGSPDTLPAMASFFLREDAGAKEVLKAVTKVAAVREDASLLAAEAGTDGSTLLVKHATSNEVLFVARDRTAAPLREAFSKSKKP
jgi:hypothetical protein